MKLVHRIMILIVLLVSLVLLSGFAEKGLAKDNWLKSPLETISSVGALLCFCDLMCGYTKKYCTDYSKDDNEDDLI